MSSLSNQPPASPFSEYSELCKVPPMAAPPAPQPWDWQHQDMGAPKSLSGVPHTSGLTDEDKLCFFDSPAGGGMEAELKVPGRGTIPGSGSFLGSAGESPDSPLSSSPSSASPGNFLGSLAGVGNNGVVLPVATGSPIHHHHDDFVSSPSPLSPGNPAEWNPTFSRPLTDHSPRIGGQQAPPNYCVIGVVNDNYMEGGDAAAMGGRQGAEGVSEDEEEEEEVDEDLQPCYMGRAEQQRKAMRRAMSECSHLAVPASLQLPDKYPGGGADLDELPSPAAVGSRRANPGSMRRSLTVADDQPPTPPPTLSAAGTARSDLRQERDAKLHLPPFPPFPPFRDLGGGPLSPMEGLREGEFLDKDEGVLLPVPTTPKAFNGTGGCLGGDANPFAMATEGR